VKLRWTSEARRSIEDAKAYIAEDNPAAARRVVEAIIRSADMLRDFPLAGRVDHELATRVLTVPRTPYRLIYELDADFVRILSVWHGAREWPPRER